MEPTITKQRALQGVVVSDRMKKTVVVAVTRIKKHAKYKVRYKVTKKLKAHDENGQYHIGDKVILMQTKPLSKDKRWKVIAMQAGKTSTI